MAFALALFASGGKTAAETNNLPSGFVYLRDVASNIRQDMRYATPQNFTGRPVPGYEAAECVLKKSAAEALKTAEARAKEQGLSLKVYDCYRPARAVRAFLDWAKQPQGEQPPWYHPHIRKSVLVPAYIAATSSHSSGAAVDVTLVSSTSNASGPSQPLAGDCTVASGSDRDGSLNMGTAFDCFDPKARTDSALITRQQRKNRRILKEILERSGFKNYPGEWWHFALSDARDSRVYDFPIKPRPEH
ncbi:MAG: M15 family metallopeptidase [Rhodomicrobium sp.]